MFQLRICKPSNVSLGPPDLEKRDMNEHTYGFLFIDPKARIESPVFRSIGAMGLRQTQSGGEEIGGRKSKSGVKPGTSILM
jgi:hypothetical protein